MPLISESTADFKRALISKLRRHVITLLLLNLTLLAVIELPGLLGHEYVYPWRLLKVPGLALFWLGLWTQREAASDLRAAKRP